MIALNRFLRAYLLILSVVPCIGQTSVSPEILRSVAPETKRDPALERAIRDEVGGGSFSYAYNRVHLSKVSAPEALVYLQGSDNCGSGGCTALILSESGGAYRLVTRVSLVRTPIIVSAHRTNGWNDLIVFVSGGGIQPGYYAVLRYDGKNYPDNPSVEPAVPLRQRVKGVAYLSGADKAQSVIVVPPGQ